MGDAEVRCEWGPAGLAALRPWAEVIVIVDVLSFCTAVDIVLSRGGSVIPAEGREEGARLAEAHGVALAGPRGTEFSLSPESLLDWQERAVLVLPSPNGARLSCACEGVVTLAGCLRNRLAVAAAANRFGVRIGIIAAGERWPDGSLRPALEDWLGAGAIIASLDTRKDSQARAAEGAFQALAADLADALLRSPSGRELAESGFRDDVRLAAEIDASQVAPLLMDGCYRNSSRPIP